MNSDDLRASIKACDIVGLLLGMSLTQEGSDSQAGITNDDIIHISRAVDAFKRVFATILYVGYTPEQED